MDLFYCFVYSRRISSLTSLCSKEEKNILDMSIPTNRTGVQSQNRFSSSNASNTRSAPTSDGNTGSLVKLFEDVYRQVRDPVLFFCRRVIFGPVRFKILVSFTIIIIGSFFKTLSLAPESYFSSKSNIFNRYFAKLGWAWTMGLLGPFVYLSLIKTHDTYQILTRHLIRLAIATGLWYIITFFFVHYEEYTGYCLPEDMRSSPKRVCIKAGHKWEDGIDFSGHTFLLLYALLIINEEVKSYDKGTKKIDQANAKAQQQAASGDDPTANGEEERWQIYAKLIRILYVLLAALTILWEFMLLSTALYFHHTLHKLAAAAVAVFCWYVTYYVWYRTDHPSLLYPSKPKE